MLVTRAATAAAGVVGGGEGEDAIRDRETRAASAAEGKEAATAAAATFA